MNTDVADGSTGHATIDRTRIEAWATEREAIPIRATSDDGDAYTFVHRDDVEPGQEELPWPVFLDALEEYDLTFVHAEDTPAPGGVGYFAITQRDRIARRAGLDRTELDRSLADGETVTIDLDPTSVEGAFDGRAPELVAKGGGSAPIDYETPMGGGVLVHARPAPTASAGSPSPVSEGELTPADRGKPAVDTDGNRLGTISAIEDDVVHVEPIAGLTERLKARLGWGDTPRQPFSISSDNVASVTGEHVVLEVDVPVETRE